MTEWADLTLSREAMIKQGWTEDTLIAWLRQNATRWAFGRETGDSGYEHLQCRLCGKLTLLELTNLFSRMGHVSRTHARDFDYVLKDGNYVCSWKMPLLRFADVELKAWQAQVKELFAIQNDRQILVVVDKTGGAGKSFLAKHMESLNLAKVIPKMSRAEDMISAAMVHPADGYIFDIPRAEEKKSVPLWTAIEQIKSGHLYDWRYQYRECWIEPPRILVFSNVMPPFEYLSKDRWVIISTPEQD